MTPRVATALDRLRQHMAAEVVFDGDVLVIVRVDPELTGSPYLIIDESRLNLGNDPTPRTKRRDHLRVVR
jgi:hypothetical protein